MSTVLFTSQTTPSLPTSGKVRLFIDSADNTLKSIDSSGTVTEYVGATDEHIQDVVGGLISAASSMVVVSYNDAGNILSIDIDPSQIDHQSLLGAGTNTHAQIDSHIANTSNPHSVTKAQVGLGSVPNVDTTNPANIIQDATHRFVTDTEKSTWNAKQDAITGAASTVTSSNLTANRIVQSDASGKISASTVTTTTLGFLDATSSIQTQLDAKVDENAAITGATKTKITYDSKGLVTAGADASLDDLSDVVISNPQLNELLGYNGTNWVNMNGAPQVNAGTGVTYFLSNTASGISTYELMSKTPDSGTEVDESISVTNTSTLFESYIADTSIGTTSVDAGIWEFNFYSYVSSTSGISRLKFDMYKRTSGGTETLLFTTNSDEINSTTVNLYTTTTVTPAYTCNDTDKLLLKVSAVTDSVTPVTIHLVHSGSEHYSHFHSPLVTRHNDLAGLQGGQSSEYNHLTNAEYTGTGTGNFVRAASPTLTGIPVAPTAIASTNTTQIATTAYVKSQLTATAPTSQALTATAAAGTSTEFAHADHVHAFDNTGVTAATYGSATQTSQVTVNAKGQITSANNTTIAIPSTQITDFTEATQDVVGALLLDSTSIDFTYNDVGNSLTAVVLPGGVDHNALLNGGGNTHIDHSAVSITAGTGLTGGGTIAATRTLSIANTGVTAATYGSLDKNSSLTVNAQGQITAASETNIVDAVLTGLDTVTQGTPAATDSILQAIGFLTANDNTWTELKTSTNLTNNTSAILTNITELQIPVTAGKTYMIETTLVFQSAATITGIALSYGNTTAAGTLSITANIPTAADGTAGMFSGWITAFGDTTVGTGVQASNTPYVARTYGVFICTTSGTIRPQFRTEVNGSTITLLAGCVQLSREF